MRKIYNKSHFTLFIFLDCGVQHSEENPCLEDNRRTLTEAYCYTTTVMGAVTVMPTEPPGLFLITQLLKVSDNMPKEQALITMTSNFDFIPARK